MPKEYYVTKYCYASHSQRLVNYFVDGFIGAILFIIILILNAIFGEGSISRWYSSLNEIERYFYVSLFLSIYCFISEAVTARTIGKFISKTMVVDEYGEKPNMQSLITRSLSRIIPFEMFSFLTEYCRGWHDKISYTYVVDIKTFNEEKKEFYEEQNAV